MPHKTIHWTDYLRYRASLRGFRIADIERILRYSEERYVDTSTGRLIAVGKSEGKLVIIPYEENSTTLTPVTVHATSRQQIRFRIKSGRFTYG